ncbi:MAG TPA: hypothetical protein VE991_03325 [Acidimicrobiales bacterium]|nr:hypothetical protein [Acidimicrobiales bacterium]
MRSSILTALGAVVVVLAFTALRGDHTSSSSAPPTSTSTTATPHRLTVVPPTTAPAPTTTAVPPTTTATSAPIGPCQAGDVRVSTVTDATAYQPGQAVQVTTTLQAVRSCVFNPVSAGPYNCPSWIVVTDAQGQVWPWPGEGEECSAPAATVLSAGDEETLRAAWNGQVMTTAGTPGAAPPGSYSAVGTWAWSTGSGQSPAVVSSRSGSFSES